jgi:hypothetical protein
MLLKFEKLFASARDSIGVTTCPRGVMLDEPERTSRANKESIKA